jgi:hypothetical protein
MLITADAAFILSKYSKFFIPLQILQHIHLPILPHSLRFFATIPGRLSFLTD